jgi:hypothetical protein
MRIVVPSTVTGVPYRRVPARNGSSHDFSSSRSGRGWNCTIAFWVTIGSSSTDSTRPPSRPRHGAMCSRASRPTRSWSCPGVPHA